MTDNPDPRRYAVMTRSHRPGDTSLLALRDGGNSHNGGFWTDDRPEEVALLSLDGANDKAATLRLNNPQVHRAEKALKIITDQRDAQRALAPTPHEDDTPCP